MSISVIIPNYNGESLLKKNLPKVIEAVEYYVKKFDCEGEIIVSDDCSTDNSVEIIQNSEFRIQNDNLKLKIIINEKNFGFASNVNKAVKEAKGEILVLLNTDVSPQKDFLEPLVSHFKDSKVFAVGCMDKSIENGKTILRGRGVGRWQRGLLVHARGEVNASSTLWVNGGSGAFRKSIWEKLGGFNELYSPFYWEDIDLSYKALKSGYKILFEKESIVVHEHEKGIIKKIYSADQIKRIAFRNQFIFVWSNLSDSELFLSHFLWLPYHFLKAVSTKEFSFFPGFLQAFILLPKIIQSSFKTKKLFIKTDKEVIEDISALSV